MTALFTRSHKPYDGASTLDAKGHPYFTQARSCSRCGGAGGSSMWAHTGWTCFECSGTGKHKNGPEAVRLYTTEELTKLDASKVKRDTKKQAANDVKVAAWKAEADARQEAFQAQYGTLLIAAEPYVERSSFVKDVVRKARETARMSERQEEVLRETIAKMAAEDTAKAASGYVGTVGERVVLPVTVDRIASYDREAFGGFNRSMETVWIVTMRDDAGNAIISKTPRFHPEKGEKFTLRATVKEHNDYRGEKQTVVQRCTIVTPAAQAAA